MASGGGEASTSTEILLWPATDSLGLVAFLPTRQTHSLRWVDGWMKALANNVLNMEEAEGEARVDTAGNERTELS